MGLVPVKEGKRVLADLDKCSRVRGRIKGSCRPLTWSRRLRIEGPYHPDLPMQCFHMTMFHHKAESKPSRGLSIAYSSCGEPELVITWALPAMIATNNGCFPGGL